MSAREGGHPRVVVGPASGRDLPQAQPHPIALPGCTVLAPPEKTAPTTAAVRLDACALLAVTHLPTTATGLPLVSQRWRVASRPRRAARRGPTTAGYSTRAPPTMAKGRQDLTRDTGWGGAAVTHAAPHRAHRWQANSGRRDGGARRQRVCRHAHCAPRVRVGANHRRWLRVCVFCVCVRLPR